MKKKYSELLKLDGILNSTSFKFESAKEILKFVKLTNEVSEKIKEYEKSLEAIMSSFDVKKNVINNTYELEKGDARLYEINKLHEGLLNEEVELKMARFLNGVEFEMFIERNIKEEINLKNMTVLEDFLVNN